MRTVSPEPNRHVVRSRLSDRTGTADARRQWGGGKEEEEEAEAAWVSIPAQSHDRQPCPVRGDSQPREMLPPEAESGITGKAESGTDGAEQPSLPPPPPALPVFPA